MPIDIEKREYRAVRDTEPVETFTVEDEETLRIPTGPGPKSDYPYDTIVVKAFAGGFGGDIYHLESKDLPQEQTATVPEDKLVGGDRRTGSLFPTDKKTDWIYDKNGEKVYELTFTCPKHPPSGR